MIDLTYRRQAGELTWRVATREDLPALIRLWNVSDRALKEKQDRPLLFARPVLLTLVAENKQGEIVDGVYLEATVDVTKIGCSEEGFAGCEALVDDLHKFLRERGFRMARIAVPRGLSIKMAEKLHSFGFRLAERLYHHWVRKL